MSQMSFSDFEYAGKRKQPRRERFLAEMEQVVPWSGLVALIEPHYPKDSPNKLPTSRKWTAWRCRKPRFSAADYWKTKA